MPWISGKKIGEETPDQVRRNPKVMTIYLAEESSYFRQRIYPSPMARQRSYGESLSI